MVINGNSTLWFDVVVTDKSNELSSMTLLIDFFANKFIMGAPRPNIAEKHGSRCCNDGTNAEQFWKTPQYHTIINHH